MKKSLFILFAALLAAIGAKADIMADWRVHMPFDSWPTSIAETPKRVYFASRTFELNTSIPERAVSSNALYYYDKEADEIFSVNTTAGTNGNAVACMAYNQSDKYMLVVYTDCNIDFIYDDGRIFNVPALKVTSMPGKKEVNSISFYGTDQIAFLATSFGYIALSSYRHEVTESRNYGENIQWITRSGNYFLLCKDDEIFYAPAASQRFNLNDYTKINVDFPVNMVLPLTEGRFIGTYSGQNPAMSIFSPTENGGFEVNTLWTEVMIRNYQMIDSGWMLTGNVNMYQIYNNLNTNVSSRPQPEWTKKATRLGSQQLWVLDDRNGLKCYNRSNDTWVLAKENLRPNSPATYISSALAYSPTYGMLAGSNGADLAFSSFSQQTPANVSALKGGFWKEYGYFYTNPGRLEQNSNFFGLAIDPINPNHVWRSNTQGGLMRMNLSNPDDVLILANTSSKNKDVKGFIEVVGDQAWASLCRFTTPQFTPDGTMWTIYNNNDQGRNELWSWPAADRQACTSAATYRPMKKTNIPKFPNGNDDVMITLSRHKNMVVIGGLKDGGSLMIFDHNGTPEYTGDDRYVFMTNPYDQDGGGVTFIVVNALAEDPETGIVYIMTQRGLFTVNPATVFDAPNQVNRIKVARNDGTNLADYLLNEINVNHMSIDAEGRKWFSTSNGLVCTSKDCRTILGEFTTDNSYLPGNNIFATAYNPDNGSLMVATEGGLVEMFPSGSGGSTTGESEFRAYPNPVEPDYYGWVRIDNLADGSLVKITDAQGGIVKELGPVQGGSVEWDVSGYNNRRVSTGVYYIMVSPGSNGGSTQIQKILVLN